MGDTRRKAQALRERGVLYMKADAAGKSAYSPDDYKDIINLPHHISSVHPQMSMESRAAQFSPFAALTGYEDAIKETGRLTEERIEQEEDEMGGLDRKLRLLQERIGDRPEISVTYFRPDVRKKGGAYVTVTGRVRKIDLPGRSLVMEDGSRIAVEAVTGMEGGLFS